MRKTFLIGVIFTALLFTFTFSMQQTAQAADPQYSTTPEQNGYVTNGQVFAIVNNGTTTYIGGTFTLVGPHTGSGVPVSTSTGTPIGPYPKVNGTIKTVAADGSGGWYIGGNFTKVGDTLRNYLAHILANGTLDFSWNPNPDKCVNVLLVNAGTIYVGGEFTSIGNLPLPRNYLAAIDSYGYATSWNPNANGSVVALAAGAGKIYVAGNFSKIGSQTRYFIAAIDAAGNVITNWDAKSNSGVIALAVSDAKVYVGGSFTNIGGQPRTCLAALDANTGLATVWNPNPDSTVSTLAVNGNIIYAGGNFTSIGGQNRRHLAALTYDTGVATTWNPNPELFSTINNIAVNGNIVYVGGSFDYIGGQQCYCITAIDSSSGNATSWNPGANGGVSALAVNGSTIYIGGDFTSVGSQYRNKLAALNSTGAVITWNPNVMDTVGSVYALAVGNDGTVYAGGRFTIINSKVRSCLAAITSSGTVTSWNPTANPNGIVRALAVRKDSISGRDIIYAGGDFISIGGQTRKYLAAIDSDGYITSWNPDPNDKIFALAVNTNTIYAAGKFNAIGAFTQNRITALDFNGNILNSWNNPGGMDGDVNALALNGGIIYIGGNFTSIGTQARNHLAALNSSSGDLTTWNPNADSTVSALAVNGNAVYAGGTFSSISGQTRNRIAEIDSLGIPTSWNPNANNNSYCLISSLTATANYLYTGGLFINFGDERRGCFTQFKAIAPNLTYTITSTTGSNGSISPSGAVPVNSGTNKTFTITPTNTNYRIADVLVDGVSVGAVTNYTFNNVTANHTISASFAFNITSYTITATAGVNGSISPLGTVSVNSGTSKTFTITPTNTNYRIADVLVDGVSVGAVTNYTFSNITANHIITASFSPLQISPITVLSPNNGTENFVAGGTLTIRWSGNTIPNVKILLFKNGVQCNTISSSTPTATGSYSWQIPWTIVPGTDYKVKITSTTNSSNPSYTDLSDNNFSIVSAMKVTSPNSGTENWKAGTTQTVSWAYRGNPGTHATIWLVQGNSFTKLNTKQVSLGSNGVGSFAWAIPVNIVTGNDFKIQVTVAEKNSVTDDSDNYFTISK